MPITDQIREMLGGSRRSRRSRSSRRSRRSRRYRGGGGSYRAVEGATFNKQPIGVQPRPTILPNQPNKIRGGYRRSRRSRRYRGGGGESLRAIEGARGNALSKFNKGIMDGINSR